MANQCLFFQKKERKVLYLFLIRLWTLLPKQESKKFSELHYSGEILSDCGCIDLLDDRQNLFNKSELTYFPQHSTIKMVYYKVIKKHAKKNPH